MRRILAILAVATLLFAASAAAQQSKPATEQAKAAAPAPGPFTNAKDTTSYAIGVNIARSLSAQGLEINPQLVSKGFLDVMTGGTVQLSDEQVEETLTALQQQMQAKAQEKAAAMSETNRKEGEAFLAANKTKEGVATTASGLQYKVITMGTGPKPKVSDTVTVNYRGTLINGTEFDSSYKRNQPATFPLGNVIKGWTEGVQLMPVGSKFQFFIPAQLAYGDRGAGPQIGPGATLIFEVELLSIKADTPPATK